MKTIGVLFDVSGSMRNKFDNLDNLDNLNQVDEEGKKSDELIKILKKLSQNIQANIFTILFGLLDEPYVVDFIKLLKIYDSKLKELTCEDENNTQTIFRDKLISYLSKDKEGNDRYCNIREYVMSDNGPSEKLSEFFCNLMEEDRSIVDNIYDHLPEEVTDENKNTNVKIKIGLGKAGAGWVGGKLAGLLGFGLSFIPVIGPFIGTGTIIGGTIGGAIGGNKLINNKVKNTEKEETLKAIKNSFKQSIEIITEKVMNIYKEENNTNYKLIKGSQLYELIENLNKKIISPKEQNYKIIDIFEKFIYGNTPLYKSCKKAFEIFESTKSTTKILLIISDGLLNDTYNIEEAQNDIKTKIKNCEIITICIYLNSSDNDNKKTFYNKIQPNFDSGAKFLFKISSSLDYHNNIIKFFIDRDWNIPKNGICKLFAEINNSEDLNQFIELLNQSIDFNDPIDKINAIITNSLFDKIVNDNYIMQFKSEDQENEPFCWAYALSAVIYLRNCSIFGRKIKKFEDILNEVKKEKEKYYKDGKVLLKDYPEMIGKILEKFKLKCKEVKPQEARIAVMKGRPCLCIMYLKENGMNFFNQFFFKNENKKEIFTKEKFGNIHNLADQKHKGHVVVLTSIEEKCLKFLNSYGEKWGDNGYFRLKNEKVFHESGLGNLKFLDVYWDNSVLSKEEKELFNNNNNLFIKQAKKYLTDPNIDIKQDLEKQYECPKMQKNIIFEKI